MSNGTCVRQQIDWLVTEYHVLPNMDKTYCQYIHQKYFIHPFSVMPILKPSGMFFTISCGNRLYGYITVGGVIHPADSML